MRAPKGPLVVANMSTGGRMESTPNLLLTNSCSPSLRAHMTQCHSQQTAGEHESRGIYTSRDKQSYPNHHPRKLFPIEHGELCFCLHTKHQYLDHTHSKLLHRDQRLRTSKSETKFPKFQETTTRCGEVLKNVMTQMKEPALPQIITKNQFQPLNCEMKTLKSYQIRN